MFYTYFLPDACTGSVLRRDKPDIGNPLLRPLGRSQSAKTSIRYYSRKDQHRKRPETASSNRRLLRNSSDHDAVGKKRPLSGIKRGVSRFAPVLAEKRALDEIGDIDATMREMRLFSNQRNRVSKGRRTKRSTNTVERNHSALKTGASSLNSSLSAMLGSELDSKSRERLDSISSAHAEQRELFRKSLDDIPSALGTHAKKDALAPRPKRERIMELKAQEEAIAGVIRKKNGDIYAAAQSLSHDPKAVLTRWIKAEQELMTLEFQDRKRAYQDALIKRKRQYRNMRARQKKELNAAINKAMMNRRMLSKPVSTQRKESQDTESKSHKLLKKPSRERREEVEHKQDAVVVLHRDLQKGKTSRKRGTMFGMYTQSEADEVKATQKNSFVRKSRPSSSPANVRGRSGVALNEQKNQVLRPQSASARAPRNRERSSTLENLMEAASRLESVVQEIPEAGARMKERPFANVNLVEGVKIQDPTTVRLNSNAGRCQNVRSATRTIHRGKSSKKRGTMFGLYTQQEADGKREGKDAYLQQLRAEQGASTSSVEVVEHDAENDAEEKIVRQTSDGGANEHMESGDEFCEGLPLSDGEVNDGEVNDGEANDGEANDGGDQQNVHDFQNRRNETTPKPFKPKRGRDTIFLLNYGTGIIPKEENM